MENVIMPKKVPGYLSKAINEAVPMALKFLEDKYGKRFDNVKLLIQPNSRGSHYFSNSHRPHKKFGSVPVAGICTRGELLLYEKKSIGEYRDGFRVGPMIQTACSIVHELTHHIQFLEKRKYSEVETTKNELDFLKMKFPEWYEMIMIEEKQK